ncbi:MAG: gas vesicle protein [Actinomycetota bacterium]|nr:gas vesicle protein [Actinomycetota bacterium]
MSERAVFAGPGSPPPDRRGRQRDVTLLELLDRLLEGGVAIHGEVTLAVADIDLVRVGLRLVVASVESLEPGADRAPEIGGG